MEKRSLCSHYKHEKPGEIGNSDDESEYWYHHFFRRIRKPRYPQEIINNKIRFLLLNYKVLQSCRTLNEWHQGFLSGFIWHFRAFQRWTFSAIISYLSTIKNLLIHADMNKILSRDRYQDVSCFSESESNCYLNNLPTCQLLDSLLI